MNAALTAILADDLHQPDDARFASAGEQAAALMLGMALRRLGQHKLHRCADCYEDLPDNHIHSNVCDDCTARRHELDQAA
jgi:hypothetical protein